MSSMAFQSIPHMNILNSYLIPNINEFRSQSQKLTLKNEGMQPHIHSTSHKL